nr:PREDICTED: uncharacterized protein LOC105668831 [Linepithema humile]
MTQAENNIMYNSTIINCEEYVKKWQAFLQHCNVHTYILKFKEQLAHNPFLQVATFVAVASLLAPIILFIIFAIVSAVFAFVGFMMIQVTVLAIGASILSCVLFCTASTFIMIGLCILFIYYTFHYTSHAFNLLTCKPKT